MNNVSQKKNWNLGLTQVHVELPPVPLIKFKSDGKSDKYFVKLKLFMDPTSGTSDLYEFKMSLFDNGNTEEFLLFVRNFKMNRVVSGTLETGTKVQYLRTLVHGEALHQFDLLYAGVEITNALTVEYILKGLAL